MTSIDLIEKVSLDKGYLKKIAKQYIELGDFKYVELELKLEPGSIDEMFEECPDLAAEFDEQLTVITRSKMRREGSFKIFKIIKALYEVLEDRSAPEDGGPSLTDRVKAANTLAKLLEPPKAKKGDKASDLDDLMRLIESDSET